MHNYSSISENHKKPSSNVEILKKFKQYMAKDNINSTLNLLTDYMETEYYH